MPDQLSQLHDERAALIHEANSMFATAPGGHLTAEEEAKFNRLHDAADAKLAEINKIKAGSARAERHNAAMESLAAPRGRQSMPIVPAAAGRVEIGRAMPEFRGMQMQVPPGAEFQRRASAPYVEAFQAYIETGVFPGSTMQTDITEDGGRLAPPQFVAQLIKDLDNDFWFRQLARVLPPTSAPGVTMPRRTARASAFTWGGEIQPTTEGTGPKIGSYNLTPHYMSAEFALSKDLMRAGSISAEAVLIDEIKYNATELEEQAFMDGDGDGKPLGIFKPSTFGIGTGRDISKTAANMFDNADHFLDARYSIKPQYMRSESFGWITHRLHVRQLAKLKATTGEPLWYTSLRDGQPDTFLGFPVRMSEYAPTPSGVSNALQAGDYVACLGALLWYDVLDGLELGINRHTDSNYDRKNQIGFIARRKVDGCPRDEQAFARVKAS